MSADSDSALTSKNYRTYLYGSTLSVLGIWIQRLAIGWHAWELTESAAFVGIIASAQFLPLIILTPFFGVIVDRISLRGAAIVMHAVLAANAALLGFLTSADAINAELLMSLAIVHGVANSAYAPIRHSLIPELVDPRKLPSAVAINAIIFNTSRFVGPGLAGAVVAWYGIGAAYLANAASYVPAIFILMVLRIADRDQAGLSEQSYLSQLLEGLRYTRDHAPIRQVVLLAGVTNFFSRGILELMPAFAAVTFAGGSGTLASLMASAGVGAIIGSFVFSSRAIGLRLHGIVVTGAVGAILSIAAFAFVTSLAAGMIVVAMLGLFASLVAIGSQTEVQVHVENRLRGRVMSLWTITIVGGPALGAILAGAMVGSVGATPTSLTFAFSCLVLIAIVGVRRPDRP